MRNLKLKEGDPVATLQYIGHTIEQSLNQEINAITTSQSWEKVKEHQGAINAYRKTLDLIFNKPTP